MICNHPDGSWKGSRTPSSFGMIGCVRLKFLKRAIGGSSAWHCLQPRGLQSGAGVEVSGSPGRLVKNDDPCQQ
jgi:hypothetical protein